MELMNDVFYWYEHGVPPSNAANSPKVFCGIWHCPFFGVKEYKMLVPKKKKKKKVHVLLEWVTLLVPGPLPE